MTESDTAKELVLFVEQWQYMQKPLKSYLARRGFRREEIEDILQDIALKLLRSRTEIGNDMTHFQAMAYTAAKWAIVDRIRRPSHILLSSEEQSVDEIPSGTDPAVSLALQQAWNLLNSREQQVMELRDEGILDKDIAATLNISEATVRSIARRAKAKIAYNLS